MQILPDPKSRIPEQNTPGLKERGMRSPGIRLEDLASELILAASWRNSSPESDSRGRAAHPSPCATDSCHLALLPPQIPQIPKFLQIPASQKPPSCHLALLPAPNPAIPEIPTILGFPKTPGCPRTERQRSQRSRERSQRSRDGDALRGRQRALLCDPKPGWVTPNPTW